MSTAGQGSRLSPQQRRLWLLQGGGTPFRAQCAVLVRGPLERERLERAAAAVVGRHEILRTTFRRHPGLKLPLQVPNGAGPLPWEVVELAGAGAAAEGEWIERLLREERRRPSDLGSGPLGRWVLLAVGAERHVLLLSLPALCADVESLDTVVRELAAHYAGAAAELPPEPLQYADFAAWSDELLREQSEEAAEGRGFWAALDLAALRPPVLPGEAAADGFLPEVVAAPLAGALARQVRVAAEAAGVPLADFVLAAWAALLWRLEDRPDLILGRIFAGRGYEDLAGAVGPFARCLPLPFRCVAGLRFEALLGQAAERVRQAAQWEEYGLPPDDAASEPHELPLQFEAVATPPARRAGATEFAVIQRLAEGERFRWCLRLEEADGSFALRLGYDASRCRREEACRLGERLGLVLAQVAADRRLPLGEIEIVTPAERQAAAAALTGPPLALAAGETVLSRFAAWVEHDPGRPAVVFEDVCLSYGELAARARRLAGYLVGRGLACEDRVALCLERSADMVVAMLAVLEAGGAYVPLDPDLPPRRLERMLAVAAPACVLTTAALAGRAAAPGVPEVRLDADAGAIAHGAAAAPPPPPLAESLAYLIFTSGSTGQPKGVAVTHANLLSYVAGVLEVLDVPDGAEFALVSTLAADLGYTAVFPALATGGVLQVVAHARAADPEALAESFSRRPVDVLKIVPSHLEALLAAVEPARVLPRRRLVLGGEALRRPLVERVRAAPGPPVVINHYGPTETTVGILTHRPDGAAAGAAAGVPIGRPLANARARLLDACLRAVPAGATGEIFLGGPGVSRGYFGDPATTAERFVPDPYGTRPGERLYRSGDLGRWRPEDGIEFAGRADHQIKLRGFRIEPGEIESCLAEHPEVREAVATVREERPGERRLVAYFTAAPGAAPDAAELRAFLRQRLPEPMVPAALVPLARLPLTANGKVDRQALPAPDRRPAAETACAAPRTPVEALLAEVWREVLGVPRVGVHDNFFELGGDSILVIQVVARTNRQGLRLLPGQFFQHQTIAELAAAREIPLTPIQRWFFEQDFPRPQHWNQAVLLAGRETLDPALLVRVLHLVRERHEAFRLRFERTAAGWVQRTAGEAPQPARLPQVDLAALPPARRAGALEAAAGAAQAALDLAAGPLLAGVLFRLGGEAADRLLLVAHHLVMDAVSWRVLLEDLGLAYRQLRRGEPPELPPPTTPFGSWAERLAEHARSGLSAEEIAWWCGEPDAAPEPLPVDFASGDNTVASRQQVSVAFDRELTRRLLQVAPAAYRTQINDLLLTALAQAFATWTGRRSLWIEAEGHGREDLFADVDLSRSVGWFTARYPLRLDLGDAAAGPAECLKAIKEQLRRLPAGKAGHGLLRWLRGDDALAARLRARPAPEVAFNYLGQTRGLTGEDSLFALAPEHHGPTRSAAGERRALIEVVAVAGEELRATFRYSRHRHRRETIARLAEGFSACLEALVDHCCAGAGGLTPSDVPLARLTQERLDRLVADVGRGIEDVYPLTPLQEGILFHVQAALAAGVPDEYFRQYLCRIHGPLDVAAFAGVWRDCLARHPALRTAFVWEDVEEPLQVVFRRAGLPIATLDLRAAPPGEQGRLIADFLAADRRRGFDLRTAPLLRLALLRLADDLHQLVWSYHHLLLDGWSIALVLGEAATHYRTGVAPAAGRPFRDAIAWLQRQDLTRAEEFFRDLLRGCSEPARLALPAPAGSAGRGRGTASVAAELAERETAALGRLARAERLTLNTVVQGAWGLLLGVYCAAADVVFGATVAGRPTDLTGFERMVGMFVNTLPVRAALDPREPCLDYLQRLHRQLVAARQFEHTPLVRVHRWSEAPRGAPLFETIVIFENYRLAPGAAGERRPALRIEESETLGGTNYPVALVAKPGRRLRLRLIYDPRRLDADGAAAMAEHLRGLLAALAEDPARPVGMLSPLAPAERERLLVAWNATAEETGGLLHRRFLSQAERTPDAVAVEAGGERLSYRDLASRSGRLARALVRAGVGPEARVAVLAERSAAMVVALVGVLRAGGAYVPLDPAHPRRRLEAILEDAAPAVLLADEALLGDLPAAGARVLGIAEAAGSAGDGAPPPDLVEPDHLAYVIFTSGSTGRPKGVEVPHRALANLLATMAVRVPMTVGDTLLAVTTLSFDIAALELFLPLVTGATTAPADEATARDPARLAARLAAAAAAGAPVMQATPAAWQMLLDWGWRGEPRLRALCGGEALPRELAERLRARCAELWNVYGPTETTIWSTCHRVAAGGGPVPIGRPLGNTEALVLDAWLRPAPVGVPGDLYLGGLGLARGYRGRPDLTAAAFVPHPFARRPGERLYRTGDQVRRLPDGTLEFLGRRDSQVKVRGFRIELGEIEAALSEHPRVRQAAVVAREDAPGHRRLVAYLVAGGEPAPAPEELRQFLRGRLPDYMVPALFTALAAMPLTPNGKLDRQALPAPARPAAAAERSRAPRNALEETIAAVWSEVLGVARVGVDDNFFELGGDSVLTIRILARLHQADIRLTPLQVFDLQTVARLAEAAAAGAVRPAPAAAADSAAGGPELELTEEELQKVLASLGGLAE